MAAEVPQIHGVNCNCFKSFVLLDRIDQENNSNNNRYECLGIVIGKFFTAYWFSMRLGANLHKQGWQYSYHLPRKHVKAGHYRPPVSNLAYTYVLQCE